MALTFGFRSDWRGGYANAAVPRLADPARLQQLQGRTMGTTWSLRFDNPAMLPLADVRSAIESSLSRVIAQMSHWEAGSDISRFNRAAPGSRRLLAAEFARVMACALQWAEASGGAIDPTVGALVAAWGFGPHAEKGPAGAAERDAAFERTGWQRLAFAPHEDGTATLLQPGGCTLDLSGIAKGFAVDHGADALHALGLRDFLFEIGGELRGVGCRPDGQPWRVQLDGELAAPVRVALRNQAIATSGDRWHQLEHEGRRWSHTIDARNGQPVPNTLASVTVLHAECMQADALATVLTVLGPSEGFDFAAAHGIAALFVAHPPSQAVDALPSQRATDTWIERTRAE